MILDDCLQLVNEKRRLHTDTLDLVWDATIEREAQAKADESSVEGNISFDENNWYGKAAYTSVGQFSSYMDMCQDAIDHWYVLFHLHLTEIR